MITKIRLTFHNCGLRSYIEVDLCRECPRQDGKGCCGNYSPVFYPTDFAYLIKNAPEVLDKVLGITDKTVLDASITINNSMDEQSYLCAFHSKEKGCLLEQHQRESICRHFVCAGIGWEKEKALAHWKDFFIHLTDYEIELNNAIAEKLKALGLSLRNIEHHPRIFACLPGWLEEEITRRPFPENSCPAEETITLTREIDFGQEWVL